MACSIPPIVTYAVAVLRRANSGLARRITVALNGPPERWRSALYALEDELDELQGDEEDKDAAVCLQLIGEIVGRCNEPDKHNGDLYRIFEMGTMYSDALLNANYHYDAPEAKIGDAVARNGSWWVYGVYDFLEDDEPDDDSEELGDDPRGEAVARLWSSLFTAWLKGGMEGALALAREAQPVHRQARSALVLFATWERAVEAPKELRHQWAKPAEQRINLLLAAEPDVQR